MSHSRLAVLLILVSLFSGCSQLGGNKPETVSLEEHAAETLKLKGRIADLEAQLEKSEQANAQLQQENTELSQRIEMLKVLDQAVEEKRKNLGSK
ncbi:MAG: hypothetical protein QNI86_11785 [Halieaceae bacterium]|nr:hypothetical protein [Halieaceae bacterium]